MTLPDAFLGRPIAHRALHDIAKGRPENSLPAVLAAIEAGYGIEIDLQMSHDGVAIVFHDYDLGRLTDTSGPIAQRSAAELGKIRLLGADTCIPTLDAVLEKVSGRVPLLIEMKDQQGRLGETDGRLEQATALALRGYAGAVAVMSFNPHMVANLAALMPDVPRGLTTEAFDPKEWRMVPAARLAEVRGIPDYTRTGACFISHDWRDLERLRVSELRADGAAVLCWTIRSPDQQSQARRIAQNITFEGYMA